MSRLLREGSERIKREFEVLLRGEVLRCPIDEQIVFNQLDQDEDAVWSLLVAAGYLNRRGFFEEAQALIARRRTLGKRTLILYVDMNNLKIINDRYGHEDGDFSLKTIAQILAQTVENRGVTGRIGGDEYACAIAYDAASDGTE